MTPEYRKAIQSIESSGGNYSLLGPVTKNGDRAYGAYQVMGNNIPEWTQKHLGRSMSPQEFLADTDAQDKVFDGQFGSYVNKYGNPQDAASAWFTGGPQSTGARKADVLGTTGSVYVDKFNKALGQGGDGVSAINTAAGIKPPAGLGALTSAFAGGSGAGSEDTGALSANNTLGGGILSALGPTTGPDRIAEGLTTMGSALAGISSPQQAAALNQQLAQMKKSPTDAGNWSMHVLPNGKMVKINNKTAQMVEVPGNYAKAEKPEADVGDEERKKLEVRGEFDRYNGIQDGAKTADEQLTNLGLLRKAANNPDVTFGGTGNVAATAKNIAYSMGIDVKGLSDTQTVERIATQLQLAKGKQLPGAISNYEDQLMSKANGFGLDKSRESNIAAIDAAEELAKHQKQLAAAARQYKMEHGGKFDEGWDTVRERIGQERAAEAAKKQPAVSPTNRRPLGDIFK